MLILKIAHLYITLDHSSFFFFNFIYPTLVLVTWSSLTVVYVCFRRLIYVHAKTGSR